MHLACPGLVAGLTSGHTIITPNRLFASIVSEQQLQANLDAGDATWYPPPVFSVGAWLADCWQQARYAGTGVPTLLSPAQERAVWQDLIEAEHPSLFDYDGAVELALAATRIVAEWHIPADGESWSASSDTTEFHSLYRQFRQRANREGWITRADLWRLLPDWIGRSWWDKRPIIFTAFQAQPPALAAIVNRLGSAAQLAPVRSSPNKKLAPLIQCTDLCDELETAARWARHQHETNPKSSIALFVPNLQSQQQTVQRILQSIFYCGDELQDRTSQSVFHLDGGELLLNHPLVASACLYMELALPRLDISSAGAILRSPFLTGAAAERNTRAITDSNLRRYRDLDVSLFDLERASSAACPALGAVWSNIRRLLQRTPSELDLAGWSEFIVHLLSATGWPGDGELSSTDQEIVEDWQAALSDLAALGIVSGTTSLPTALAHLRSLLASRYVAGGDLSSPIQILDAASPPGLRFDASVVVGLCEEAWPPPQRTSPFIPLQLQRSLLASNGAERSRATEALFSTAPTIVAMHSGVLAPCAHPFTKKRKNDLQIWDGLLLSQSPPNLTTSNCLEDPQAPPFHPTGTSTPGGVSILKAQSQCPFQAFAKYRLAARRPEDACFGFDARERGSFLHRALEVVWRELKTRDRLKATSPAERRNLIHEAVEAAIGKQDDSPFHQLAGEAERTRLEEVILEWLSIEENRDKPFTVEHIEKDQSLQIAGLPLNLRIDRVDRLPSGSAVLIDYKSGEPKLKSLEGERPAEPQLLVYAAAMNEPVDGLFFAQLKPRALKAVGWSRNSQFPVKGRARKNTRQDWDDFMSGSQRAVQQIAAEFVSGWADVHPEPGACTFCNLKPLCRVNEMSGASEESEDAD